MPFGRIDESRYTPEQKTAYKVFYFCLSIVVVGTVILISSLRYSESNVVKEIVGVILVILGASLCYFMCLQIRRTALEIPKPQDSQSCNSQLGVPGQQEEMAYVIVDSTGKFILHPLSSNAAFNQRPSGEPPLLIMSSPVREDGNVDCHNLVSSSSNSVVVPWPLSMNRRRQLAQMQSHNRDGNRITNSSIPTIHQTRNLPPDPPPYYVVETNGASPHSSTNDPPPPASGSPPPYEDIVGNPSTSRS